MSKKIKPVTPGLRFRIAPSFDEITSSSPEKSLLKSSNNLKNATVKKVEDINTYDIVNADSILFVEDSVKKINEILK